MEQADTLYQSLNPPQGLSSISTHGGGEILDSLGA